jgi:hypothetical protein
MLAGGCESEEGQARCQESMETCDRRILLAVDVRLPALRAGGVTQHGASYFLCPSS